MLDTFKIEYDENEIDIDNDQSSSSIDLSSSYPPIPRITLHSSQSYNNNKPSIILPINDSIPLPSASSLQTERHRYNTQSLSNQTDLVKSPNIMRYGSVPYESIKPLFSSSSSVYQNNYRSNYRPLNSEDINSVFDGLDDKINQLRGYL